MIIQPSLPQKIHEESIKHIQFVLRRQIFYIASSILLLLLIAGGVFFVVSSQIASAGHLSDADGIIKLSLLPVAGAIAILSLGTMFLIRTVSRMDRYV